MIIIKIIGGLGNQMFQYAFYKFLLSKNLDTKIDISAFNNCQIHNGYELEKVFSVKPIKASIEECYEAGLPRGGHFNRILRKLHITKNKGTYYQQGVIESLQYEPNKFNFNGNMYLDGYWSSYKWFQDIFDDIKNDFKFKHKLDDENKHIANDIINSNSISLHIRRGDYLKYDIYQGICTLDGYYKKAIEYILERVENAKFFIFSNDIGWCKQNLKMNNIYYVNNNNGENSYKDMQLMSLCKHNITANSSFSFLGGHLNANPQKIVICPHKFLNLEYDKEDIFPESWIRI